MSMHYSAVLRHRFFLICLGGLLLVAITACGGGSPTAAPSPTASRVVATSVPTLPSSAVQPTPTLAASPTTVAVTPTVAPVAAATATRVTRPAATAVPASPKPSGVSGKLAYSVVTSPAPEQHSIWTIKADGTGASKLLDAGGWPAFSPDGKRLAFYQFGFGGKNPGIYVGDAFGGNAAAVVINVGACCFHWSRDGQWIVYALSNKPNQPGGPIHMVKVDGTFKTIVDLKVVGNGPAFSPDGRQVVYSGCEPGTNTCGLRVVAADGTGVSRTVTRDNGGNAEWSPRGDKIVYQADDGANHIQVFVVNADGSGKKQLTTGKGNDGQPIWSRDGNSIFWRSDQNHTAWAIFVMNADGSNRRKIVSDVPPDPNLWGWESLTIAP